MPENGYHRGIKVIRAGLHGEPRYALGECVRTKSGLRGRVIGSAEYVTGWEHRVKVEGRRKTLYRKEKDLRPC